MAEDMVMERPVTTETILSDKTDTKPEADPNAGKQTQDVIAPATGKSDSSSKVEEKGQEAPSQEEARLAEVRKTLTENIGNVFNPTQAPEDRLALVEKQLKASSDDGQRNNAIVKGIKAWAEKQGLKLDYVLDKDENGAYVAKVDTLPTEKYSKDAPTLKDYSVDIRRLSQEEQDLAIDDPQKFADIIASRAIADAQKALVRAVPTAENVTPRRTDENIAAVVEHLTGTVAPELKFNKDAVLNFFKSPSTNKAIVNAFHADPATMLNMANALVAQEVQKALKRYEENESEKNKQRDENDKQVSVMPGSGSNNQLGGSANTKSGGFSRPNYRVSAI